MGQPSATQLQNQYLPPGQFPVPCSGRGSGPVGVNQQEAQPAVPSVRVDFICYSAEELKGHKEAVFLEEKERV